MQLSYKRVYFSKEELELLKEPAGILIKDNEIDKEKVLYYINKPIISIGDATTDKLIMLSIIPDIQIVDGKERRSIREPAGMYYNTELRCNNPPSSITYDAIKTFKDALIAKKPVRIIVDGEEDLLALVALVYAPLNSTILYGQPFQGLVILTVNIYNRNKFKNLMDKIIKLEDDTI